MARSDEATQRFYARLAARAEAEEYCHIEQVARAGSATSSFAEDLDAALRHGLEELCSERQGLVEGFRR